MGLSGNKEESKTIKVFISYSHDSEEHKARVLKLSNQLRADGIDCNIDKYETSPPEGWTKWMIKQLDKADFVLIICTEIYKKRVMDEEEEGKGQGVKFESTVIFNKICSEDSKNRGFIPVVFDRNDIQNIPVILDNATYYCIDSKEEYVRLYRRLTNQPEIKKPDLGSLKTFTTTEPEILFPPKESEKTNDGTDKIASKYKILLLMTLFITLLVAGFLVMTKSDSSLKQPDPYYYNLRRPELLKADKKEIRTIESPWIVLSLRKGVHIYKDSTMNEKESPDKVDFLDKFEVIDKVVHKVDKDKTEGRLKVKSLDGNSSKEGWVKMEDVLYLPVPLRSEETGIYQTVLMTRDVKDIKNGESDKFRFYNVCRESEDSDDIEEEKEISEIPMVYIYAWDGDYALLGAFPAWKDDIPNNKILKRSIYGWSKKSRLFLWKTRVGLIPNLKARTESPPYIFLYPDDLRTFYDTDMKVDIYSEDIDGTEDKRLILKPGKKWNEKEWPLLLAGEVDNTHRLFCNIRTSYTSKIMDSKSYCQHFGYAKLISQQSEEANQFFRVYVFREEEINKIIKDLKKVLAHFQGEKNHPKNVLKHFLDKIDEAVFGRLPVLFKKTRQQVIKSKIGEVNRRQKEVIKILLDVADKLTELIEKKGPERSFGQANDQYLWLCKNELL